MKRYAAYLRDQVTELLTQFGTIDIIWFDFSYPGEDGKGHEDWESEALLRLVRKLQPDIVINDRLDLTGAGDIATPEQYQPETGVTDGEGRPVAWEACQTFSGSWGYHRDEMTWKSVDQLLRMLVDGVSKGGNLLLNVGPTARGEFDARARDRLAGMGRWMHHHGRAVYGCGAAPAAFPAPPPDCRYTYNAATRRLYVHLFAWPFRTLALPGLAGKVAYAQFLHDASEVRHVKPEAVHHAGKPASDAVVLRLPDVKPPVDIPVVEIFLEPDAS
jgi:alpha-L-fucosidase